MRSSKDFYIAVVKCNCCCTEKLAMLSNKLRICHIVTRAIVFPQQFLFTLSYLRPHTYFLAFFSLAFSPRPLLAHQFLFFCASFLLLFFKVPPLWSCKEKGSLTDDDGEIIEFLAPTPSYGPYTLVYFTCMGLTCTVLYTKGPTCYISVRYGPCMRNTYLDRP